MRQQGEHQYSESNPQSRAAHGQSGARARFHSCFLKRSGEMFKCVSMSCRHGISRRATNWSARQHINIKFDVFRSIETHRVKRFMQSSESKLNSMVGTSPASQDHSFARELYLERPDPAFRSRRSSARESPPAPSRTQWARDRWPPSLLTGVSGIHNKGARRVCQPFHTLQTSCGLLSNFTVVRQTSSSARAIRRIRTIAPRGV